MDTRTTITTTLSAAKPALLGRFPIKHLAIFGSVSRGEDTPESDVDIMVEFSEPVGMEFIHLALELEKILRRKVDLVSRGGIKPKYFAVIQPDLIYV